jgi:hypothetical protein
VLGVGVLGSTVERIFHRLSVRSRHTVHGRLMLRFVILGLTFAATVAYDHALMPLGQGDPSVAVFDLKGCR